MATRLKIVSAVWLLQVVNYADRVVMGFAGPSMMHSLHIAPKTFGVLLSSFAVGYFISQVPGGLIADRWGSRVVLVAGPLFWAIFTGLTGLVTGLTALIVVRLCFGLSEGLANAATYKVLGDNFDSQGRARAVAVWVTAFALAPALTGPLVGMLVVSYGWQTVFVMLAVPAVAVAIVNFAFIPRAPAMASYVATGSASSDESGQFVAMLREPSLWIIAFVFMTWNVAYWGFLGWMPSYLALQRHIDVKSSGVLGGIPYVFGLIGGVASGWLSGGPLLRHRPEFLAVLLVLGAGSLGLAYASGTVTGSIVALSCTAACIYGALSLYGAIMLDWAPADGRAKYSGIVSTIGQVGSIIAPLVIGHLVSETGSFGSGFAFMGAALCVGGLCALGLLAVKSKRRLSAGASSVGT